LDSGIEAAHKPYNLTPEGVSYRRYRNSRQHNSLEQTVVKRRGLMRPA